MSLLLSPYAIRSVSVCMGGWRHLRYQRTSNLLAYVLFLWVANARSSMPQNGGVPGSPPIVGMSAPAPRPSGRPGATPPSTQEEHKSKSDSRNSERTSSLIHLDIIAVVPQRNFLLIALIFISKKQSSERTAKIPTCLQAYCCPWASDISDTMLVKLRESGFYTLFNQSIINL